MRSVKIFTDGACSGNPGPGGWGAVLQFEGMARELYGGEAKTTNNRMELTAAIEALAALRQSCKVQLTTDSIYVRDGVTRWLNNWKRNGWKTSAKKDVKNQDLWLKLDQEIEQHEIDWHWVKGHSGHPGNERADALANTGMAKFKNS